MNYLQYNYKGGQYKFSAPYIFEGGTKKLCIRTKSGTATSDIVKYPLTTDTTASKYCQLIINVNGSQARIASSGLTNSNQTQSLSSGFYIHLGISTFAKSTLLNNLLSSKYTALTGTASSEIDCSNIKQFSTKFSKSTGAYSAGWTTEATTQSTTYLVSGALTGSKYTYTKINTAENASTQIYIWSSAATVTGGTRSKLTSYTTAYKNPANNSSHRKSTVQCSATLFVKNSNTTFSSLYSIPYWSIGTQTSRNSNYNTSSTKEGTYVAAGSTSTPQRDYALSSSTSSWHASHRPGGNPFVDNEVLSWMRNWTMNEALITGRNKTYGLDTRYWPSAGVSVGTNPYTHPMGAAQEYSYSYVLNNVLKSRIGWTTADYAVSLKVKIGSFADLGVNNWNLNLNTATTTVTNYVFTENYTASVKKQIYMTLSKTITSNVKRFLTNKTNTTDLRTSFSTWRRFIYAFPEIDVVKKLTATVKGWDQTCSYSAAFKIKSMSITTTTPEFKTTTLDPCVSQRVSYYNFGEIYSTASRAAATSIFGQISTNRNNNDDELEEQLSYANGREVTNQFWAAYTAYAFNTYNQVWKPLEIHPVSWVASTSIQNMMTHNANI